MTYKITGSLMSNRSISISLDERLLAQRDALHNATRIWRGWRRVIWMPPAMTPSRWRLRVADTRNRSFGERGTALNSNRALLELGMVHRIAP